MRTILTAQEIYQQAEKIFNDIDKPITKQQLAEALNCHYRVLDRWLNSGHVDKGIEVFFEKSRRKRARKNLLVREKAIVDIILNSAKKLSDNGKKRVTQMDIVNDTELSRFTVTKYVAGGKMPDEFFNYIELNRLKVNHGKAKSNKNNTIEVWKPDMSKYLTQHQIDSLRQHSTTKQSVNQLTNFRKVDYDRV